MYVDLKLCILSFVIKICADASEDSKLTYVQNPAPDGHRAKTDHIDYGDFGYMINIVFVPRKKFTVFQKKRCGVCPTYFQKICGHDLGTSATFIFDNHCVMDLYNCIEGTRFAPMRYDKCLYFGNFAYVHGFKYTDMDYKEDFFQSRNPVQKNPDFIHID